jgi:ABC-2 type transport system ATP-binding protein
MSTVVEIVDLTKDYDVGFWPKKKVRALDGLSLKINRGEIFGFLGANGAGKTTTLKILMSLIFQTSGSARILDHDIRDVAMHSSIGYLPENPYFYDYLTAREFVDYCGQLFGMNKSDRKERTRQLLTRVNLDEKHWNVQLRKFSKGMLQRVGLAQALINNPEVVFLDEPMSGLDPIGRREVRDLIASMRQEGKTVFMCSHILSDIEVLCDRVGILKNGKLAHVGFIDELRQRAGASDQIEIIASGLNLESLQKELVGSGRSIRIASIPGGVRLELSDEKDVDETLAALRRVGGKLISVQPLRQSLEELFLD